MRPINVRGFCVRALRFGAFVRLENVKSRLKKPPRFAFAGFFRFGAGGRRSATSGRLLPEFAILPRSCVAFSAEFCAAYRVATRM
jgi:hypothetical protein